MNVLLSYILFSISYLFVCQSDLDSWIEEVKSAIISGENIEAYSLNRIPPDVAINFVLVHDLVVTYQDSTIIQMAMIGPGNSKTGCLEFSYVRSQNGFYLQFGEFKEVSFMGTTKKFISPWVAKYDDCTR